VILMPNKPDFQQLSSLLGPGQVLSHPAELLVYEVDAALDRGTPDVVVFPQSTADVQRVVRWAAGQGLPVVSRGAGTGLSGGAVAEHGGLILAFSRLNRLLELDIPGRSVLVEPGMVNQHLDEQVRRHGLYFPPDPASGRSATLGGNVAENAGGPHCFKYGVTTNYITGLEFVLSSGEILTTGGPAFDYPEYDFNALLAGSEGTLAAISRIRFRLLRQPPAIRTLMAAFESVEHAGRAVSAVIAAGLVPATMEMMDQKIARIVEDYAHPGLPIHAGAVLIIDLDGYPSSLDPQENEITRILQQNGGTDLRIARTAAERDQIWFGRKSAAGAMARLAPAYLLLDGTVPRSLLAQALEMTNRICEKYELRVGYVFHAGDGNLHPFILTDPRDPELLHRTHQAGAEFMQAVLALGGSITGEHGVGIDKRPYMSLMYSPAELNVMRSIKQVFDPLDIFNPGKVFPPPDQTVDTSRGVPVQSTALPPLRWAPESPEDAAAGLAALSRAGESLLITGRPLEDAPPGRVLSTCALNSVSACAPEDLYVTAGAGMRLDDLHAFLAPLGLQTTLRSPWPGATLGGLLAANVNAPLRMRYGGLRDQVLAMTLVLGDGRLVRLGRPVVKNVAGYDLPKVLVGSFGTLGLIAGATLKLTALPRQTTSLVYPVSDIYAGLACAAACLSQAVVASGILLGAASAAPPSLQPALAGAPYFLIYTAEGLAEDVASEIEIVRDLLAKHGLSPAAVMDSPLADQTWAAFLNHPAGDGLLLRLGLPPASLGGFIPAHLEAFHRGSFLVDVPSGLIYAAAPLSDFTSAQAWLDSLRHPALQAGGYALVIDAPAVFSPHLDRWGYRPQTLELMRKLKSLWDPAQILNPGAFLV
jgi:D-lactate dehydrogenase (cytochrome)